MKVLIGFEQLTTAILVNAKNEMVIGPVKCKFTVSGNKEMLQEEFEKKAIDIGSELEFIFSKIFVIHNDDGEKGRNPGFTIVEVEFYDIETVVEYIKLLVKRDKVRGTPRQMLNSFNKAIMIADDFNNRFGEGKYNKTIELNEIQDVFELMQDIHKNEN